jgi:mono/diheme cytochrome c family protein
LDTDCGDFTKPAFKSQTDGALYYKTAEGRKDMPAYKKKIPDANDIWAIVNYMRTF